jgi:hypothetical protein
VVNEQVVGVAEIDELAEIARDGFEPRIGGFDKDLGLVAGPPQRCAASIVSVLAEAQPRLTPSSLPIANVSAPAAPPISNIRAPPRSAPRPVNRLNVDPTANNAAAVRPMDT